jgi:hypothetical protein
MSFNRFCLGWRSRITPEWIVLESKPISMGFISLYSESTSYNGINEEDLTAL